MLSSDMLYVSIGTFSYKIVPTLRSLKKLHPIFETVMIHAAMNNKRPDLVCEFQKTLAVIFIDQIFKVLC